MCCNKSLSSVQSICWRQYNFSCYGWTESWSSNL